MSWLLTTVEAAFLLTACAGIWLVYPPAALIVGGLAGVLACERR